MLNNNTVLLDVLQSNVAVRDARDGTGCARDGLDADTVVRVDNSRPGDDDVLDNII